MTAERAAEFKAMYEDPNFIVDTSDIPEWTAVDFKNGVCGRFYSPAKNRDAALQDADAIQAAQPFPAKSPE